MNKSDFYFDLPQELIAQDPLADRSGSRLLMLDKRSGRTEHHIFRDIVDYLRPGDCLVLNNTKVLPARLMGIKEDTGAAIEVLLLKRYKDDVWETLGKPGKSQTGNEDRIWRRLPARGSTGGCGRGESSDPFFL